MKLISEAAVAEFWEVVSPANHEGLGVSVSDGVDDLKDYINNETDGWDDVVVMLVFKPINKREWNEKNVANNVEGGDGPANDVDNFESSVVVSEGLDSGRSGCSHGPDDGTWNIGGEV